jgi:hypothetical protein
MRTTSIPSTLLPVSCGRSSRDNLQQARNRNEFACDRFGIDTAAPLVDPALASGVTIRTKDLLVIAGPPCAGKTTFISRIRAGRLPSLCEQIGLRDPDQWTYLNATDLARTSQSFIDRLAVHYDLIVQRSPRGYRHLPQMIGQACNVVLLTLWTDPQMLRRRSRARLLGAVSSFTLDPLHPREKLKHLRKMWRRYQILRDAKNAFALYNDWFDFASRYPNAPHWVFNPSSGGATVAERFETAQDNILVRTKSI